MRHYSTPAVLTWLVVALLTGCGGGGEVDAATSASASLSVSGNPPLALGAGATTPSSGSTTTTNDTSTTSTIGTITTSTTAGAVTTNTAATSTTTAAPSTSTSTSTSTTSGLSTTSTASTTTTTLGGNGALPPLSSTRTILTQGAGGQVLGMTTWPDRYNAVSGQVIGGVSCNDWNQNRNYFNHAHLSIFKNGERLAIPQYIGWSEPCIYDINTDNRNGVIDQVSATGYKFMSLGQFFTLWDQPLSWTNVAGITGLPIVIYIEDAGVLSRYTGDPANIEIGNYRSITIQIGSPLAEIPVYDWQSYTGGE